MLIKSEVNNNLFFWGACHIGTAISVVGTNFGDVNIDFGDVGTDISCDEASPKNSINYSSILIFFTFLTPISSPG